MFSFYHPLKFVCWVIFHPSVRQIWQLWVNLCGATSPRRSSWRASVRRSPTYCLIVEPEMGPLLCSSKSSTRPCLTSALPAMASLTPSWRRYAKRGIDKPARDTSMHTRRERTPTDTEETRKFTSRKCCPSDSFLLFFFKLYIQDIWHPKVNSVKYFQTA